VEVDFGGGEMGEAPAEPIRTYRGTVAGKPGSVVAAFEANDGLHAKVVLADGNRYWVEPIDTRLAGDAQNLHAIYHNDDVISSLGNCDAHDEMRVKGEVLGSVAAAGCTTLPCVAEIACDADVEFYLRYGSVSGVENRINAIINGLNVEYERDAGIRHIISTIIVRIAEPDPYTSTAAQTLLNEFRNHWQNNHASVPRDTAELFTGKNIDGSTIGIAWIGTICNSYSYSVVQADCCGTLACATDLSAHELGHNWNAGHCTCASTTMNPSITCANVFHPTSTVPVMTAHRDSRTCLGSSAGGCTVNADCSDGNPCTTDTCVSGVCVQTGNIGPCNDGLYCNGADSCSGGACSVHSGNPCTGGAVCANACNEATDNCLVAANTACTPDTNPCTHDVCNGSGTCTHPLKAAGSSCNDNLFCNGTDSCNSSGVCVRTGNPCPGADGDLDCSESCNETTDLCTANDANGTSCGPGDSCQNGMCVTAIFCGDNVCSVGESCANCPADCGFAVGQPCSSRQDCCSGRCRRGLCRP